MASNSAENITNKAHYPNAGEHHRSVSAQYWSLAPKPIPTGYPAIPQQLNLHEATPTTIDYGKGNYWGFEFGTRVDITLTVMMFFVILLTHLTVAYAYLLRYDNYLISFIKTIPESLPYYFYFTGGAATLLTTFSIMAYFKASKQVPVRFNREKRQVFAVVDKELIIADWESVSAQVETALFVSPHSAIQHVTLTLQIPDMHSDRQATLSMGYAAEALAIADWEALRVFMEHGLDALKAQTQTPELLEPEELKALKANPQPTFDYYYALAQQCQEGSLEYFYAIKNQNKYSGNRLSYAFWLIGHVLSGWTFPCHVAEWLNKKNYVKRPKALIDWSQPIPKDQWAKPSIQLTGLSQALLMAYRQPGVNNFKDYFGQNKKLF